MQEGIQTAFEKLLADTSVLENAILASTAAYREGEYQVVELLPTGEYRIFSATPLDEPYAGPGVCLKIPPLLEEEIDEDTQQPSFRAAIRTLQDAFSYLTD
jgi:hypothetical protein